MQFSSAICFFGFQVKPFGAILTLTQTLTQNQNQTLSPAFTLITKTNPYLNPGLHPNHSRSCMPDPKAYSNPASILPLNLTLTLSLTRTLTKGVTRTPNSNLPPNLYLNPNPNPKQPQHNPNSDNPSGSIIHIDDPCHPTSGSIIHIDGPQSTDCPCHPTRFS